MTTFTAFGNLYNQVQLLDGSLTAFSTEYVAYLDSSVTAYLDASVTAYLTASVTDLAAGAVAALAGEISGSLTTMSSSLSDISASLTNFTGGGGGPQSYSFYDDSITLATDINALLGTDADPPYIYMYTGSYTMDLSLTTEPIYSGYTLPILSLEYNLHLQLPATGGPQQMEISKGDPTTFLYRMGIEPPWQVLPGLYPNNSLTPVAPPL